MTSGNLVTRKKKFQWCASFVANRFAQIATSATMRNVNNI